MVEEASTAVVVLPGEEVRLSEVHHEVGVVSVVHQEEEAGSVEVLLEAGEAASVEEAEVVGTKLYHMLKSWSCMYEAFRNTHGTEKGSVRVTLSPAGECSECHCCLQIYGFTLCWIA